jgi:hypothetical protein
MESSISDFAGILMSPHMCVFGSNVVSARGQRRRHNGITIYFCGLFTGDGRDSVRGSIRCVVGGDLR